MKLFPAALACLAAALFTVGAAAQLRAPGSPSLKPPGGLIVPPPETAPPANTADPAKSDPAKAEKERAGVLAANGWLVLLDRRDWGRAWDTSSSVFRGTVPLANWMDNIPKVRAPLGNLVERQQVEARYATTLQGRPDGEYVSVIFDSKFEQKKVQEIVTTVLDSDGKWRVTGYSTR